MQAVDIVKDIDIDDVFFVALYLYKKHKIWTTDKPLRDGLEKKGYKICVTTAQNRRFYFFATVLSFVATPLQQIKPRQ